MIFTTYFRLKMAQKTMKNYSKTHLILLRYQDQIFKLIEDGKSCREIAMLISKKSIHTKLKRKVSHTSICEFIKKQKNKYANNNIRNI